MKAVTFAIPGDIATISGGYNYDRRVMEELRGLGFEVRHCALPASFPDPAADDCQTMLSLLNAPEMPRPIIIDGLAWGALPHEVAARVASGLIALCHHPLGLENGLDPQRADYLLANETANLSLAGHIIATSAITKQTLVRDLGQQANAITIAEPGTEEAPRAKGSPKTMGIPSAAKFNLLCVGAVIPRKGYDVLVRALARIKDLDWHLSIAGSLDRSPECTAQIRALISEHDLAWRVDLAGEMSTEQLQAAYHRADLFILPSHYEGYGMVLGEAMARGLAIITTTGGAAADTVPEGAGLKVAPGDCEAMEIALRKILTDTLMRQTLSDASWRAGQALPRWRDTAAVIASVINRMRQEVLGNSRR